MSRPLLVSCEGIGKAYGVQPLFESLCFSLAEGDRVGLVGPNGSGKTTLLRILAGLDSPDAGTRSARKLLRLGYVPQDPTFPEGATVEEIVRAGLTPDDLETAGRVAATLGRAGLADPRQTVALLSAGWRKRLAIARELVGGPDLLLMDEPTNHLDLEGILWLEDLLAAEVPAYLVISHDRYFLENVTDRVLELNPCYPQGLFEADGSYSAFLLKREEFLRSQAASQEVLANKVRREVEWLRRGPKARTRKSSARIKAAGLMIGELAAAQARAVTAIAGIEFTASGRQSKKLLLARDLAKTMGDRRILEGLNLTLTPGMRLGLLGASGSGKSTLLDLLAGRLAPDGGEIERADGLRVVRFSQDREGFDPALSLRRTLAPEGDAVVYRDRSVHVVSWAKRFLFRAEQLETAMGRLSGGERARVCIARLMLEPADLLLLDEPTNDLDIPTLEVLEESLAEFSGALVLVTRDRFLLDRVSTAILALDGAGGAVFYADVAQWEAARADREAADREAQAPAPRPAPAAPPPRVARGLKRLTYQEQREWEQMEETILAAETALTECQAAVEDPAVASDPAALRARWEALESARAEVARLYARWAELEVKQG
ncbi:MAG: ABC-F family ATP-binding cassette domain-containing protein [candidate division NC10 bacterium]|nr:ABC-F family ATP-binding cassette domain-containing protein [candidate division NC10 bacterium]